MTDAIVSDQLVPPTGQQATAGFIEIARFNGQVLKIQELTIANRDLTAQLAAKTSENEQLRSQLTMKDTEKTIAVSERDKQLNELVTAKTQIDTELAELRALKLKLAVAKKLGKPGLMSIIDRIPSLTDEEALTTVMGDFAKFAEDAAADRERQLLAGITPSANPLVSGGNGGTPNSAEGWQKHINNLTLGTRERKQAMDQYGDWLEAQHK